MSDYHINYMRVLYFLKFAEPSMHLFFGPDRSDMEAISLSQIDTDWPADSLEFCPHAGAADILVCGTYKLEESTEGESESSGSIKVPQRRKGKCLVFRADEGNGTWYVIRRE